MFSPELRAKAEELVGRYPMSRSALLPLLHLVQAQDGHLSDDGISECAELLGLTRAEVAAVATFYTMYKREPMGRHLVSVCTNFSCKVRGSQDVYDTLAARLGVGHNQTTADGAITLEHAECLGNCEGAPVVTVDYLNYEGLTPEAATELVERVIAGDELPPPTRGFVPPGIRDVEHRLAGLGAPPGSPHPEAGASGSHARAEDGAVVKPEAGPGSGPAVIAVGTRASEVGAEPSRQELGEDVPAELAADAGGGSAAGDREGDLGAQTAPASMGRDSGTGAGHGYPPESEDGGPGTAPPRQDQEPPATEDPFDTGRAEGGDSAAAGRLQEAVAPQTGDDSAQSRGRTQDDEQSPGAEPGEGDGRG